MATATHQPPVIPPRPSRSQEKTPPPNSAAPMVPPRPAHRRLQRSVSPNPERFAPSPLSETLLAKSSHGSLLHPTATNGHYSHHAESIDRWASVELPSVGEEGKEYANLAEALSPPASEKSAPGSPEHTRTVADDLKLHAPKPSLPAASAKQRVMTVTRTDSERAASFGIGRPSSVADDAVQVLPSNRSLKKKASTTSQLSTTESHDDEQGIPEIGQQVPMYPNAGDVQAPSPAPTADAAVRKHHSRKTSNRGNLPPGSYGLHGHGVVSQDKLDKAYYEKHPELLKKEHTPHHYDRPNDFSMSSDDLNKIVRDTRSSGLAAKNYAGTPSDQVGWQALEESTSRVASPLPPAAEAKSPVRGSSSSDSGRDSRRTSTIGDVIHVEEPGTRRKSVMFSDSETPSADEEPDARPYAAPILADDEVAKDPAGYANEPAVEPPIEEPTSRPTSRPASLYKETSFELRPTPLEDVEEYEPLFTEDDKQAAQKPVTEEKIKREKKKRFPSADIWEDAPSSAYHTTEVSTPELFDDKEDEEKPVVSVAPPPREGVETPAQAFARHQEELAEKEAREKGPEAFVPGRNKSSKPLWAQHQLAKELAPSRPLLAPRFPSRDVWEDTPDSLKLETTVSTPQQDEIEAPSPVDVAKPEIPARPKPRQASGGEEQSSKPVIPERPKPQIPARPAKAGPTSGGLEPAEAAAPPRQKPAVPARPMGSKIAALQAGFMSDLNKRLQLGPQAIKKEEPAPAEEEVEEKEKAPLTDARKGRARGPQRRAPAAASPSPAPVAKPAEEKPVVSFGLVSTLTVFEIDPDEGVVSVGGEAEAEEKPADVEAVQEEKAEEKPADVEAVQEEKAEEKQETPAEAPTEAEPAAPKPQAEPEPEPEPEPEVKTLATNLAGEALVQEEAVKDEKKEEVEPVKVEEK